jgi:hypothetical protein
MLKGLKDAVKGMKLVNLNHVEEVGATAYKMGMSEHNNPYDAVGHDAWRNGYFKAKAAFENLMKRNGADGTRVKLWMA